MTDLRKTEKSFSLAEWTALDEKLISSGYTYDDCEHYKNTIRNMDRCVLYNNRKHRKYCESVDAYDDIAGQDDTSFTGSVSRDLLEFQAGYFGQSAEEAYIEIETHNEMLSIIDNLKSCHSDVLIAFYYYGFSFRQYSELKGKSSAWAAKMHRTAKNKLRKLIEKSYPYIATEMQA